MAGLWGKKGGQQSTVSADFAHALTREILLTELLRVKAILVTLTLLVMGMFGVYAVLPQVVERIWHGPLPIMPMLAVFVLFWDSSCRCCG